MYNSSPEKQVMRPEIELTLVLLNTLADASHLFALAIADALTVLLGHWTITLILPLPNAFAAAHLLSTFAAAANGAMVFFLLSISLLACRRRLLNGLIDRDQAVCHIRRYTPTTTSTVPRSIFNALFWIAVRILGAPLGVIMYRWQLATESCGQRLTPFQAFACAVVGQLVLVGMFYSLLPLSGTPQPPRLGAAREQRTEAGVGDGGKNKVVEL